MADETQAEPVAAIAPEAPVAEPVTKTKVKAKEPKLADNQTLMLSGNVYTAH
ncbi:hypothetical protein [Mesorhizobium sp. M0199]|uniref:hypothetical protein n=1 Tax=Mesorhizobium sp. M0199 TaxID=2956911 RepID=UPI00333510FE